MLLVLSVLASTQVFAKWNFSDSTIIEPDCLNCCAYPEFQDQCNAGAEADSGYRFYVSRAAYGALNARNIFSIMSSRHAFFDQDNGLITSTVCLTAILLMMNVVVANTYQVWKNIFPDEDLQKPEGIVLVIKAKEDWNFALNAFDFSGFRKKHLVLSYGADSISDIADAIRSVRSRFKLPIKVLVWTVHGGYLPGAFGFESSVMFGSETAALSNIYRFKRIFSLLDPDTIIILSSCSTASRENTEEISQGNVAQSLAFVAEGRRVYSTSDFATPFFEIDDDLKSPRFRGMLTLPFYVIELLSGFRLNFEKQWDFSRCYYSPAEGIVLRCPQE